MSWRDFVPVQFEQFVDSLLFLSESELKDLQDNPQSLN